MEIRWINHPSDKHLNGSTEHVDNTFGRVVIGYKQAVEIPPARRGTNEYLAMRAEQSRQAGPPTAGDAAVPFVDPAEWSVKTGNASGTLYVEKRFGFETLRWSSPPPDCPEDIKGFFERHANFNPGAAMEALEAEKRKQLEYEEKIRFAKRW